ncbi:MAG: hypothetical protein REI12_07850 [Pedobacter sp.]|nr:hypothetical protein [Pedobacter sp.]
MTPKDKALHTLGRALVNFQRLERLLKVLSLLTPMQGAIEDVEKRLQRRIEKANHSTLGAAITMWINNISNHGDHIKHEPDLFSVTILARFNFGFDESTLERHTGDLKSLLEERNAIIHNDLWGFDFDSDEQCLLLCQRLDSVNSCIKDQMDFLDRFLTVIKSLQSGDFTIEEEQL